VSSARINQILPIVQAAANYWDRYIDTSLANIQIQVNFVDLGDTTLAQAGTDYYFSHTQGGLDFWDPMTITEITTGVDLNGSSPDIDIDINSLSVNSNEFYLGPLVDGVSPSGNGYDLWTVLVHEIAHGLGLLSFLDEGGI